MIRQYYFLLPATQTLEQVTISIIVYLGIFITLAAYGLFNYGVSKFQAHRASAFVNLIPVFAVFLAWLLLDEYFNIQLYFASVLILSGVIICQKKEIDIPEY